MPTDVKITDLTAITGVNIADDDVEVSVDISDGTMAASGTDKKSTVAEKVLAYNRQAQAINAQTGTTYTPVATDLGKLITMNNAAAQTVTLPQDSDLTWAIGKWCEFAVIGAGQVTWVAGTGATLLKSGLTAKSGGQGARLGAQKISANTWQLFGWLAAS
jgi:hypothetical protein